MFSTLKHVGGTHLLHSMDAPPRCPTRLRQPDHPSCWPRTGGGHARASADGYAPKYPENPIKSGIPDFFRFLGLLSPDR